MTDRTVGVSEESMIVEQINMLDGEYRGDSMLCYRPKSIHNNNIQHKKKQIAKRRAKNKNKKR